MDEKLKTNVTSSKHWLRLVYMVIFAICLQVSSFVLWVLVALQFLFSLIKGEDNENLRDFGASLGKYIYQALQFLTYNSEEKPFPFSDWPTSQSFVESNSGGVEGELEIAAENEIVEENSDDEPHVVEPEKEHETDKID